MIVFGIVVMFYIVSGAASGKHSVVELLKEAVHQTYATRFIPSDWCFRLPFLLQMLPGEPSPVSY
jgi:hypothetical protein